jgi:hypothetical protein
MVGSLEKTRAIETNYMNCRFRSRLEARWAVFFDSLGWDWEYEKQGYTIGWREDDEIPWLPDFEIVTPSGQHFYVEVKGDRNFFADGEWLERFDFHGGPPGFPDCGWSNTYDKDHKPLLLLGDIPRFDIINLTFHMPIIVHHKGVNGHMGEVTSQGVHPKYYNEWCSFSGGNGLEDFQVLMSRSYAPDYAVLRALRAASGARFEHGEKPRGASYAG